MKTRAESLSNAVWCSCAYQRLIAPTYFPSAPTWNLSFHIVSVHEVCALWRGGLKITGGSDNDAMFPNASLWTERRLYSPGHLLLLCLLPWKTYTHPLSPSEEAEERQELSFPAIQRAVEPVLVSALVIRPFRITPLSFTSPKFTHASSRRGSQVCGHWWTALKIVFADSTKKSLRRI